MNSMQTLLAQLDPSDAQLEAIIRRGEDIVVTAGAGSGKTRTIVARYLALLADDLPLRSIVAITFTRKAAREMRNRIREEIRRYLHSSGPLAEERARWQSYYGQLDAARIGTIHSLCATILRAHPVEAAVDPRFDVLEEGTANIMRSQALEEALAWAADNPEVVPIFTLFGERRLRYHLARLLQQRLSAEEAFQALGNAPLRVWQGALQEAQQDAAAALLQDIDWQAACEVLLSARSLDPNDKLSQQQQSISPLLRRLVAATQEEKLPVLRELANVKLNLTGGRARSWPGGKAQVQEVKDALKLLRQRLRDDYKLLGWQLTAADEVLAEAMVPLYQLFHDAEERYRILKEARQALDFDDLEARTVRLLREKETVRRRWQQEIKAILVDEFQDTNKRQRDLIRLLAGEPEQHDGKLFIVGDGKQSIYRFRGADVAVFRREREAIRGGGGFHFDLKQSYRAHEGLVMALNGLLEPFLGPEADPRRPWVEPFAPLAAHRAVPLPGVEPPFVELHLVAGSKSDGAHIKAAELLVSRLIELVEDENNRLDYGQVAILFRSSYAFFAYENALERAHVPFLTVAGRGFYSRPEIRDLLNALQAVADPTDDLALAGLLRSPALALTDGALFTLSQQQQGGETLWETLQANTDVLSKEDQPRARRALHLIGRWRPLVGRVPVADLLKRLLDDTDYQASLLLAGQMRSARNVEKLLAAAQTGGMVSIGEFLEYVEQLNTSSSREGEAHAVGEGAVQIMSIHAAKGLEFPVVVIGDAGYQARARSDLLLDPELGVLLPWKDRAAEAKEGEQERSGAYLLGQQRDREQEDAEMSRLFYVAATRAREKLLISGSVGLNKKGTLTAKGWLRQLLGPGVLDLLREPCSLDGVAATMLTRRRQVAGQEVSCTLYSLDHAPSQRRTRREDRRRRAIANEALPRLLEPLAPSAASLMGDKKVYRAEREPSQQAWRVTPAAKRTRAPARVIGAIVHEAIAHWWAPDASCGRRAEIRARGYGLSDKRQLQEAARESCRLLARFWNSDLRREMEKASRRLHELPYSLQRDGRVENGIIDVLYLLAGRWTLVDFKTDHLHYEAQLQGKLQNMDYVQQVQRYLTAVETLVGERPRGFLCFLDVAGAIRLEEVTL